LCGIINKNLIFKIAGDAANNVPAPYLLAGTSAPKPMTALPDSIPLKAGRPGPRDIPQPVELRG